MKFKVDDKVIVCNVDPNSNYRRFMGRTGKIHSCVLNTNYPYLVVLSSNNTRAFKEDELEKINE